MDPMSVILFAVFGLFVLWSLGWFWAFFRHSSDTLHGMIGSVFTMRGVGWSLFCMFVGLLPLFIAIWFWSEFSATFPA